MIPWRNGFQLDCCFTPSPRKFFNAGYSADARIHNASWGTAEQGKYITYSSKVDSYLYDHDDFLAVFPSGNDGTVNSKKSINAPGTAKNVITVGASQSSGRDLYQNMLGEDYLMDFSSRGPTGMLFFVYIGPFIAKVIITIISRSIFVSSYFVLLLYY